MPLHAQSLNYSCFCPAVQLGDLKYSTPESNIAQTNANPPSRVKYLPAGAR